MNIYLCGPIDKDPNPLNWEQEIVHALEKLGREYDKPYCIYSPLSAFNIGRWQHHHAGFVVGVNTMALLSADAIVWYLDPRIMSVGSAVEVLAATAEGERKVVPWSHGSILLPMYAALALKRYYTLSSAYDAARETFGLREAPNEPE